MARLLCLLLIAAVLLGCVGSALAQTPVQPANPGTQPAQPSGDGAPPRGSTFDYVVAFAGAALVLLVVCYPSRRY